MKLDFGTAGIRGVVGDQIDQLNQAHVARVIDGYAKYLIANVKDAKNRGVIIGRDNRLRGKIFANISAKILTSYGIKVYFNNQMLATPFISFLTINKQAAGAINITASHNPKSYNGIKLYNQFGAQMLPEEVKLLKTYFCDYQNYLTYFDFDQEVQNQLVIDITEVDQNAYLDQIKQLNFSQTNLANLKIVYSPLHGTGYQYIKKLLDESQIEVHYQSDEIIEDPNFSFVANPNPESKSAFKNCINLANQFDCDLILITDPDADRLGVAIRKDNDFVLLNGNEMAILICDYLLKYQPIDLAKRPYLIYSLVSSSLPAQMAKAHGLKTYHCQTGFKWIGNLINQLQNEQFFFAFEESYGCLINGQTVCDKDAIQTFYLMLIISVMAKNNNLSLLDQLENIYQKYGYLKTETINYDLNSLDQLELIKTKFKQLNFANSTFIDYNQSANEIEKNDMLLYQFGNSWVALRPSGTEPKYKIYLHIVEKTKQQCELTFKQVLTIINPINHS